MKRSRRCCPTGEKEKKERGEREERERRERKRRQEKQRKKSIDINPPSPPLSPPPFPFSFPFLLVDRVVDLVPQQYAVGYKNVTANDNFFTGHFPDRKIMPGVLQVEAMAQLGGMVMMDPADKAAQQNFFFGGIEGCKFRRPVVPGDCVMMRVELTKFNKRFGIAKMKAEAYVGEEMCCEAELTLVLAR